ncbi:MAG: hypothetical protein EOP82_18675 [Variovorax sp.]|nr:MAG: hypothetical protein EOP82_18675 [Variovorax sp.]
MIVDNGASHWNWPTSRNAVQISTGQAGAALTPQQKRFNTLIRQIEQARQMLAAWHDNIGVYRQAQAQVLAAEPFAFPNQSLKVSIPRPSRRDVAEHRAWQPHFFAR